MTPGGVFDPDVLEASLGLIRQYGDDAEVIATLRAAELAAVGDVDGLEHWDRIIACIAALSATPDAGHPVN